MLLVLDDCNRTNERFAYSDVVRSFLRYCYHVIDAGDEENIGGCFCDDDL